MSSASLVNVATMPRAAEARAWWTEVEETRARIEERRARGEEWRPRGVREVGHDRRLELVHEVWLEQAATSRGREHPAASEAPSLARRRSRRSPWLGPRPDRIAAWAVAMGVLLVLVALLSAH